MTERGKIFKARYGKSPAPVNQCGVFVSYQVDQNGKCGRYISCSIEDHTKDSRCPARGGK